MKEQIEQDRKILKGKTKNNEGFSYIPLLTSKRVVKNRVKLSRLSTLNILVYLEEGFQKSDKHMLNNMERIKKEILQRSDLFVAVLNYLENKKVRDNLFSWTPGYNISNIFCFIVDLMPNFVKLYKEYYIERVVCKKPLCDVSTFIKERFSVEYEQFNLMATDLLMFDSCISAHIWTDEQICLSQKRLATLEKLGIVCYKDISADIEAHIVLTTSFIDISLNNSDLTVRLDALVGLMVGDMNYRSFWMNFGIDMSSPVNIAVVFDEE